MALKVRCAYCDELMAFNAETDTYTCSCGTITKLPEGKAQSDPYSGWGNCYQSDLKRKRPDAHNNSNRRKRKQPAKPLARFSSMYSDV